MAAKDPTRRKASAKVAVLTRHHGAGDPRVLDAERDVKFLAAESYITRLVDSAPPLRPEDLDRLRALLPAPAAATLEDGGASDAA